MSVPNDLLYRESHEWVSAGEIATVGVSDFAQQQLGDITFVELPEVGETFARNDEIAVIESVKAASDVYAPISGEVVEVNAALEDSPELINSDPFGEGWLFKIKISDESELSELLSSDKYLKLQQSE